MQEQLSDLQKKLSKEEEERTSVAKLNKELDKVTHLSFINTSDSEHLVQFPLFMTFTPLYLMFTILTLTQLVGTIYNRILPHGRLK